MRRGISSIEIMTVLTIAAILAALAVPAVIPALRRGEVNHAANAVGAASSMARSMAQRQQAVGSDKFGVVLWQDADGTHVGVTYGPIASEAHLLLINGSPAFRETFGPAVRSDLANWTYAFRSGSASPQDLTMSHVNGRHGVRFRVHPIGLSDTNGLD